MEELGRLLYEARIKKNVSIEKVSQDTKLTVRYLQAIEKGDLSVFKDDLTYLRYFLKAYCDYLGVDFEEVKPILKESVDTYTQTLSLEEITKYEDLPQKPRRVTRKKNEYNYKKVKPRKFDFSFASLIAVIGMIFIGLLFVFMMYVLPRLNNNEVVDDPNLPPVVEVPKEEEPSVEEPTFKTIITMQSPNEYLVSGFDIANPVEITVNFGSNSWFEARLNGIVLAEPKSQIYYVNDQLDFTISAEQQTELAIRLGFFANNSFKINGEPVILDQTLANLPTADTVRFIFQGE